MTSDTHDRGLNMPPSCKWFNQADVWLLICYNCPCHLDLAAGEKYCLVVTTLSPYASHSPSDANSGSLLVSHQLLAESKTNDIRWGRGASWQDSAWALKAKRGRSTKVCPSLGWRELKDTLQISTLPKKGLGHQRLFIDLHWGSLLPLKATRRGP